MSAHPGSKRGTGFETKRETEIKVRVEDVASILWDLRRIGAVSRGRVLEQNTLYDTPDADFRHRGRLLRVRVETPAPFGALAGGARRLVITAKAPAQSDAGSRHKHKLEREVVVRGGPQDAQRWAAIFRALGLRAGFRYEKYRTSFHLGELELSLDETPVGIFLEIEGASQAIDGAARALGFGPRDYILATYWDLHARNRRRDKPSGNMLFDT